MNNIPNFLFTVYYIDLRLTIQRKRCCDKRERDLLHYTQVCGSNHEAKLYFNNYFKTLGTVKPNGEQNGLLNL